MRRPVIAGNWKMNLLRQEGLALCATLAAELGKVPDDRELLILPPFTLLHPLAERLAGSRLALGGQDLHWESAGAYTSGISAAMLRDAGCRWVLVGHSERRAHFGDSGVVLWRKLRAALAGGLRPIYCVGESLEQRHAGRTAEVLRAQFDEALPGLAPEEARQVTLAYEPVWAIGSGETATPRIAQEAHAWLRGRMADLFGSEVAAATRILYGGSVKPVHAAELLGQTEIDGLLVGGASLEAASFLAIASAPAT